MRQRRHGLAVLSAALAFRALAAPPPVSAGAWTLPKDTGLVIGSLGWTQNETSFFSRNPNPNASRFIKREARIYLEYGVTDWLTAIIQPEALNQHLNAPNRASYTGLGYSRFALKARVFEQSAFVVSVQGQLAVPPPSDQPNRAQLGNTGPETDWRLNAGYGFEVWSRPAFADFSGGYRTRSGRPASEWRFDLAFGIRPVETWLILLQSFNAISDGAGTGGFPQQSSSKLQLSVVHDIDKHWSVQLGLLQTVASRRVGTETGVIGAVWRRF